MTIPNSTLSPTNAAKYIYKAPSGFNNHLHSVATTAFTRPDRWNAVVKKLDQKTVASPNWAAKSYNQTQAGLLRFTNLWTNYDYSEFSEVKLGKVRFKIATPPKGALLLLLFPCTVGPRLYRAYERGKQNNDYREMGDVLRRDLTAITLFVFALDPVKRLMAKAVQKTRGINLMKPSEDKGKQELLSYPQFRNFRIISPKALEALLDEGNGKALENAVNGLSDRNLSALTGDQRLSNSIVELKKSVKDLVAHTQGKTNTPEEVKARTEACEKTFKLFENAEAEREKLLEMTRKHGSPEALRVVQGLQGEFVGVLEKYAKKWRLPSDIASFALVIGLIGWAPVWFNSKWNQWKFHQEEMALKKQSQQATTPIGFENFQAASRPVTMRSIAPAPMSPFYPHSFMPAQPQPVSPFAIQQPFR